MVGGLSYSATTRELKNWDIVKTTLMRNNYDGVVRSISTGFEFVGDARLLLKEEFEKNEFFSSATLIFYRRNNSWTYNEIFRCILDFSSYSDMGGVLIINGVEDSLTALLKSKANTEFEIEVADIIKDNAPLHYDGIEIEQSANWYVTGDSVEDSTETTVTMPSSYGYMFLPLYMGTPEVLHNNVLEIQDQDQLATQGVSGTKEEFTYFAKAKVDCTVEITANFSFKPSVSSNTSIYFYRLTNDKRLSEITKWTSNDNVNFRDIVDQKVSVNLLAEEHLCFFVIGVAKSIITFDKTNISLNWMDRRSDTVNIDTIDPTVLLNKILEKMSGGTAYTGVIEEQDDRVQTTRLIAAESIRGISDARIYTSFNKFRDWMIAVFGYAYGIDGNTLTFSHRSSFFVDMVTKKIQRYNDLEVFVADKLLYTRITAGYDKQDYEEVNGRDAYHFGVTFNTGLLINDSELRLVSPYRADPLGFEVLLNKRSTSTTDSSSDKDIFFFKGIFHSERFTDYINGLPVTGWRYWYTLDRETVTLSGMVSPGTQFNGMFSPRRCILSNIDYINACTNRQLTFASSEGNSNATVDGVLETANITEIKSSGRLFVAKKISFATPEIDIPNDLEGIIEIKHNNTTYRGFIDRFDCNLGKEQSTEYHLILTEI